MGVEVRDGKSMFHQPSPPKQNLCLVETIMLEEDVQRSLQLKSSIHSSYQTLTDFSGKSMHGEVQEQVLS